jgi:prophage antirepressor-like protein
MNELQIFNYNDNEIRTIEKEDGIWWVLTDVCKVLDVKNATDVAKRLDGDEVTRFNLGGLSGESWIINESGLYNVILRSDKPEAVPFRRWVTHDVLPSIRKHGAYISDKSKQMAIEAKHMNARARVAAQWTKIASQINVPEFKQICASYASEALAGVPVLPLPTSGERHYKAGEIGDMFGVTSQRIGLIANANGLKTDAYGKWYHDKSPHSNKEVDSFRYNSKAIEKFKEILGN